MRDQERVVSLSREVPEWLLEARVSMKTVQNAAVYEVNEVDGLGEHC